MERTSGSRRRIPPNRPRSPTTRRASARRSEAAVAKSENVIFYQRLLGAGGLVITAFLLYKIIEPSLGPIAWALFIGFLLQPQQERLTKWMRGRASISAFLLTIGT